MPLHASESAHMVVIWHPDVLDNSTLAPSSWKIGLETCESPNYPAHDDI